MTKEEASLILECMAIDMTGGMAGLSDKSPFVDLLKQRIEAIDVAQKSLREHNEDHYENLYNRIKKVLGKDRYDTARREVLDSGNQGLDTMLAIAIRQLRDEAGDFGPYSTMENDDPLTLEELRYMDGEPVWIKADHYGIYADVVHIIGREDGERYVSFKINHCLQENGCGKTWNAYDCKPKEG